MCKQQHGLFSLVVSAHLMRSVTVSDIFLLISMCCYYIDVLLDSACLLSRLLSPSGDQWERHDICIKYLLRGRKASL